MLDLTTLVASSLIGLTSVITNPAGSPEIALRTAEPVPVTEPRLICKGCNENENRTLAVLQDRGITDKNSLSVILGNIRQESTFIPNICEGGARTSYRGCRSGGYGLIQWTCTDRYNGLGVHAARIGGDPSSLDTQLDYLFTEPRWRQIEQRMKIPGRSINEYMNTTYRWIGWGIHGARTSYARDYAQRLVPQS